MTSGCEHGASAQPNRPEDDHVHTGSHRDKETPVPEDGVVRTGLMTVLASHKEGAVLSLVAVPRAASNEFVGLEREAVRVRVAAPPVDGAANDALVRFLARALVVPRSRVKILSGETGRRKRLLFMGMSQEELGQRLNVAGVAR